MRKTKSKITPEMGIKIKELLETKNTREVADELGLERKQINNFLLRERYKSKVSTPVQIRSIKHTKGQAILAGR